MSKITEEERAARDRLEDAIKEVDAFICARTRDGGREGNEILTHFIVIYSHTKMEDSGEDSTQVTSLRSVGMSYWQAAGLLSTELESVASEPWRDMEDD